MTHEHNQDKVTQKKTQENQQENESQGGLSMAPPAFSLSAGSPIVQRQEDPSAPVQMQQEFPYIGLVNEAGAILHSDRNGGDSNAVGTPFQEGDRVEVLDETDDGWLRVRRTVQGTAMTGYIETGLVEALPGRIAESEHRPGIGYDGVSVADDMTHGDMTNEEIQDLGWLFYITSLSPDWALFADMRLMCGTLFSSGELYTNIMAMIDKFEANEGGVYTSAILDEAVRNHASTNRFLGQIETAFQEKINLHGGNALDLIQQDLNLIGNPRFNTSDDTWRGGLTIAVNDVWAYDVDLVDYNRQGNSYTAKVDLTLYDHFGLDTPDIEKKYKYLAGFRAWFVLQHERGYQPFQVHMKVPHEFTGTINE